MNRPDTTEWLAALRERLLAIDPDMATDEQLLCDTIDGQTDALDKLRVVLRHGLEAELFAEALRRYVKTLETRRERFEARADICRVTVREALDTLGLTSLMAPDFTVSIVAGRPHVIVTDIDALPPEFISVKLDPKLSAIAAKLKRGEKVPGAMFSNTAPILTVRRI